MDPHKTPSSSNSIPTSVASLVLFYYNARKLYRVSTKNANFREIWANNWQISVTQHTNVEFTKINTVLREHRWCDPELAMMWPKHLDEDSNWCGAQESLNTQKLPIS
jgi:hypothetical protein